MKTQLIIPVSPPAVRVLIGVKPEPSVGAKAFFNISYDMKYKPACGIANFNGKESDLYTNLYY